MQPPVDHAQRKVDEEEKKGNPEDVGKNDVHAHVATHDGDAIGQAIGGGDHLSGEEEEHHGLEVEAKAVDDLRQDLPEDDAVGDVEVVGVQGEGFDDLLLGYGLHHLGYIEDHGGRDAYDDKSDLGPLVDAEDDEENRQKRKSDDLIEEEDEAQEPGAKPGEETDVKGEDHSRNQKEEADEEATAARYCVLPDHGMMNPLPRRGVVGGDVIILFRRLKDSGTNAGEKLVSAGDDAVFRILAMPADRSLHIEADAHNEDETGERLHQQPVRPRLDVEWGKVRHKR